MSRLQLPSMHQDAYIRRANLTNNASVRQLLQGISFSKPVNPGLEKYFYHLKLTDYYGANTYDRFHHACLNKITWLYQHRIQKHQPNIFGFTLDMVTADACNNPFYTQLMEWTAASLRVILNYLSDKQSTNLDLEKILNDSMSTAWYLMNFTLLNQLYQQLGTNFVTQEELHVLNEVFKKVDKMARDIKDHKVPVTEHPDMESSPHLIFTQQHYREHPHMQQYYGEQIINVQMPNGQVVQMTESEYNRQCQMLNTRTMGYGNQPIQHAVPYNQGSFVTNIDPNPNYQHRRNSSGMGWVDDEPVMSSQQNTRQYNAAEDYVAPVGVQDGFTTATVPKPTEVVKKTVYEEMRATIHRKYWFTDTCVIAAATGIDPKKSKKPKYAADDDEIVWNRLSHIFFYDFESNPNVPEAIFIKRKSVSNAMDLDEMSFRHPSHPNKPFTPGFTDVKSIEELTKRTGMPYETYINNLDNDSVSVLEMETFDPEVSDEIQLTPAKETTYLHDETFVVESSSNTARIKLIHSLEEKGVKEYKGNENIASMMYEVESYVCQEPIREDIETFREEFFINQRNVGEVNRVLCLLKDINESFGKDVHKRLVDETNFFLHTLMGIDKDFYVIDFYDDVVINDYVGKLAEKVCHNESVKTRYVDHICLFMEREISLIMDPEARKNYLEKLFNTSIEDTKVSMMYKHVLFVMKPVVVFNTSWSEAAIDMFDTTITDPDIHILNQNSPRYYKQIVEIFEEKKKDEKKIKAKYIPVVLYTKAGNKYRVDPSPYGDTFIVTSHK